MYSKTSKNPVVIKRNITLGSPVNFDFHSPQEYKRGTGEVVGFRGNDVVIDPDDGYIYFVDAKNVFKCPS